MVSPRILGVLLLGLATFLTLWQLGSASFKNVDEALYSQCAREMIDSGDWLSIQYGAQPFLEKPPLKIWTIALGFKVFGFNEYGARLSSALFAIGTVALTMLLGARLIGSWGGVLAGAILLSSVQFLHEHCARTAEYEPETVFFFVLSMWIALQVRPGSRWIYALAASLALLALTKGPVVGPAIVVVVGTLVVRDSAGWKEAAQGTIAFLLLVLPWHLHQLTTHGELFREIYMEGQILGRLTGNAPEGQVILGGNPTTGAGFYPSVLFHSIFPWSLLFLPALGLWLHRAFRRTLGEESLLLLWVLVFFATISIAGARFSWYAIPLLPALSIGAASALRSLCRVRSESTFLAVASLLLLASFSFLPAESYSPHARIATAWPNSDSNLAFVGNPAGLGSSSWAPVVVALVSVLGAAILRVTGRLSTRQAGVIALSSALLFHGLWASARPLRAEGVRTEIAQCREEAQAAGIEPSRVLFLDAPTAEALLGIRSFFYVYDLAGGPDGRLESSQADPSALSHPDLRVPGTLLLGHEAWAPHFQQHGLPVLWRGEKIAAAYVR